MEILQSFISSLAPALPTVSAIAVAIILLIVVRIILNRRYHDKPELVFRRQLITMLISIGGLVAVIMALPIDGDKRWQLLSLLGLLLSAALTLSSTTLMGNILAGLMLRSIHAFKPGDYITMGDHFGRISEIGLLHVEIQNETRDLTTFSNLYMVTTPSTVTRSSGTIVSAEVSLGYDVARRSAIDALLNAAEQTELADPFVHIINLGDYSITYRLSGMLTDLKHLVSTRSRLREKMLDCLHEADIEIASPTIMTTRAYDPQRRLMPESIAAPDDTEVEFKPDSIVFDKAEEAASLEKLREMDTASSEKIAEFEKELQVAESDSRRHKIEEHIEALRQRRQRLKLLIEKHEQDRGK